MIMQRNVIIFVSLTDMRSVLRFSGILFKSDRQCTTRNEDYAVLRQSVYILEFSDYHKLFSSSQN